MFRVMGGKIHIFGRWVALHSGSHTISMNKDNGSTYTDSSVGTPVVSYNMNSDGHITINSLMTNSGKTGELPVKSLDWRGNSIVSRGPLFGSTPDGLGGDLITVYLEGFAFSFNYHAIVNVVSALKPFTWAGGRVCTSSMWANAESFELGLYTAIPSAISCGTDGNDAGGLVDAMNPFGDSVFHDVFETLANRTSIVYSYRTHRKYTFFASNASGLFSSPIGSIGGSASGYPGSGSIPDIRGVEFSFSMFSLRQ